MSTFEFVSVLLSIVISLAVAHLLTGVAQALKARKVRFHWVLAAWWLFVFMLCVDYWFSLWQLRDAPTWTLAFVMTWLVLAAITYIAAWVVTPDPDADGTIDFVAHFEANRRKFYGVLIAWVLGGAVVNGYTPSMELANLLTPIFVIAFAVGIIWKNRFVQFGVLAAIYAGFTYYALNFIPEL